ncbi:S24 family peptidase, partial [Helicobacter felis]|uniref:S24 family peptidase n=1 Tax=Helicobacter felis TaxID=214 RepID=UPI001F2BBECE
PPPPPPPLYVGRIKQDKGDVRAYMERVADLLHETRRAHGFKNWVQMGAAMDTPAGTLRAYSSGKTNGVPSLAFFAKLSRLADVSGILGGDVQALQEAHQARKKEHGDVLLKVYDNLSMLASQDTTKAPMLSLELRARYPKNALELLGIGQREMSVARLKNDSMSPMIEAEDYLLVDQGAEMRSGDIVVFEYGDEIFLKRVEKNPITGGIRFFSKSNVPDFEIPTGIDEKFKVIGIVRGKIKIF